MVGFAHVVLHLTLCQAAANLPASSTIGLKLQMTDQTGRQRLERTFTIERGTAMQRTVEFDSPRGVFRVVMIAPQIRCSLVNYWSLISEQNRTIPETLVDGVAPEPHVLLFEGTAPESFISFNPTFVLLDKSVQCNAPAGDPLTSVQSKIEYDDTSYYVSMDSNPLLDEPGRAVLALQIATPTGENHFVRIKTPFLRPWGGWPCTFQMNIGEDVFDGLATQPTDVLLCPRIPTTSVG